MSSELEALGAKIAGATGGSVTDVKVAFGELTLTVARDKWLDLARTLRDEPDYLFVNIIDVNLGVSKQPVGAGKAGACRGIAFAVTCSRAVCPLPRVHSCCAPLHARAGARRRRHGG